MPRQSDVHSSAYITQAGFITNSLSIYCEHGVLQQSIAVSVRHHLHAIAMRELMSLIHAFIANCSDLGKSFNKQVNSGKTTA